MSTSKPTVILTGASGFLGGHLLEALLDAGYNVIAISRATQKIAVQNTTFPNVSFVELKNIENILDMLDGNIVGIIHTATCYGRNGEKSSEVLAANVSYPLRLMEMCVNMGVELFINTDTILAKYLNTYSITKNHFLEWCKFYSENSNLKIMNLKLQHIYGPRDDATKFTGMIFENLRNEATEIALTPGEQKRDFIYVSDVVDAYLLLLKNRDGLKKFQSWELGSGEPVSIRHFVETAHSLYESPTLLKFGSLPYRAAEVMLSSSKSTELRSFGWVPKISLIEGIKLTKAGEK